MTRKFFFFILILSVIATASCNRRIRYIYNKDHEADSIYTYAVKSQPYTLKPKDILHIKIITTDTEINKLFEIDAQNSNYQQSRNNQAFYLSGFTVNDTGFVQIPVLGSIKAEGKTVSEFRKEVISQTNRYLKDAIVKVKFVSFKVSFLGEIKKKGTLYIYQDNIDILEAIARAGGVTDYANMKDVVVVRQEEQKRLVYKLDLTQRELLLSEKFYLYPNDIVILRPVKAKIAQLNFKDYFFFFSALSTTLSTILIIINLFGKN